MSSLEIDGRSGNRSPDSALSNMSLAGSINGTLATAAHRRLGKDSPLHQLDRSLLARLSVSVDIVVPDAVPTLCEAVAQALPGQRIVLRKGEYTVGATDANRGFVGSKAADTVLRISRRQVRIAGEKGAILRGMLVFEPGSSGILQGLMIIDGGDCCVKALGGDWVVRGSHASRLMAN
mmetsp:Transcript_7169/g.20229  ORF Transcript_7169/g.20229 Transcript_7169/m.20229 type:complete len:178 (-) Transcript_7169:306-839(-)